MRGFLGGDERARQAVGERAAAADLDAEADRQVDRQAADPGRIAEQRVERVDMVAERQLRLLEPGEDAAVALVEACGPSTPTDRRPTICSTSWRSLSAGRVGDDLGIVEDAGDDQRLVAARAVAREAR